MLASQSGNEEVPKGQKDRRWVVYKWNILALHEGYNPAKNNEFVPRKGTIHLPTSNFSGGLLVLWGGDIQDHGGPQMITNDH